MDGEMYSASYKLAINILNRVAVCRNWYRHEKSVVNIFFNLDVF